MIIATDDNALALQIRARTGAEVKETVDIDDIAAYEFDRDFWIIPWGLVSQNNWLSLALISRGAVQASEENQISDIMSRANIASVYARRIHQSSPSYIGHLQPSVVFVGERPNPNSHRLMTFQPGGSGCGDFLFDALGYVLYGGIPFGLMNAYIGDEPEVLPFQEGVHYVALGSVADNYLNSQNVIHSRVDHPQYVRRFHYDQIDQYKANLFVAAFPPAIELLIR